uniref:CD63 antigen n=1 Tax=Cacopsylla melanoneura TaxID=428564 RepID=A0A8D8ZAW1_9HEMI
MGYEYLRLSQSIPLLLSVFSSPFQYVDMFFSCLLHSFSLFSTSFSSASLFLAYALLEDIQDPAQPNKPYESLSQAMNRYASDMETKIALDQIQMKLKCCGSRNYTDWYNIPWSEDSNQK